MCSHRFSHPFPAAASSSTATLWCALAAELAHAILGPFCWRSLTICAHAVSPNLPELLLRRIWRRNACLRLDCRAASRHLPSLPPEPVRRALRWYDERVPNQRVEHDGCTPRATKPRTSPAPSCSQKRVAHRKLEARAQVHFEACSSQLFAGGLFVWDISSGAALNNIQMERVSFKDCSAGGNGGGFMCRFSAVEARQLSFEGCTAGARWQHEPRAASPE